MKYAPLPPPLSYDGSQVWEASINTYHVVPDGPSVVLGSGANGQAIVGHVGVGEVVDYRREAVIPVAHDGAESGSKASKAHKSALRVRHGRSEICRLRSVHP